MNEVDATLDLTDALAYVRRRIREYQAGGDAHALCEAVDRIDRVLAPASEAPKPRIVCLCGSTRFYDEFQQANYDLTMAGKIVLSVGFYSHAKAQYGHGEGIGHDSEQKVALDELHLRKIDLADEIFVVNVSGYIGESTRREIAYAKSHSKPIAYLEPPGSGRAPASEGETR